VFRDFKVKVKEDFGDCRECFVIMRDLSGASAEKSRNGFWVRKNKKVGSIFVLCLGEKYSKGLVELSLVFGREVIHFIYLFLTSRTLPTIHCRLSVEQVSKLAAFESWQLIVDSW
jgi:hypothetical protein